MPLAQLEARLTGTAGQNGLSSGPQATTTVPT
jgi:hypothetical protein